MVKTKIRIGFAGTPKIAFDHFSKLLSSDKLSVQFVLTQPNKTAGRGLSKTESLFSGLDDTVPVFQFDDLNSNETKTKLASYKIDLLVVVAYGKIIPEWLLEHPKHGCLNVHFSLLPKYRGAAPMQRAIQAGETVSGISFMKLQRGLDEGPVYKQIEAEIKNKNFFEVESLLLNKSISTICSVIEQISEGAQALTQNHSEATYANKITRDEGKISWEESYQTIANKFLAFRKWPQSFFLLNGEEVKVTELNVQSNEKGTPGEIQSFNKKSLNVFCGNGVISISEVKFPGKKVIGSLDFFNSKRDIISKGDLLI
ncbi:MAG: methionyl-tRNA formyltransferase [Gammaproteobacteria bacterium]|nr:methionyl-tRNA formyltransferase [Gammaproteobacteria bacterium]